MPKISKIIGREILDSRGFPTVEADLHFEGGAFGRAAVPSGASTGIHEALELRDGDALRFQKKGVLSAVSNVNGEISKLLLGTTDETIFSFDQKLIELDGTENKSRLGANAILAVSLAWAKAMADHEKTSLAEFIYQQCQVQEFSTEMRMPIPLMNVINGGAHANNSLDIQEFMLVPHNFPSFKEALRAGVEIFHSLRKILDEKGLSVAVGDEGGFAPSIASTDEALDYLLKASELSSYQIGEEGSLALDVAATEFYRDGRYHFAGEGENVQRDTDEMLEFYSRLLDKYPIVSIEDPLAEDDWDAWKKLTEKVASRTQLVGDDLFVTQEKRLSQGIRQGVANSILIKLNQVGTLAETLNTMRLASQNRYHAIVSHRSGETEDTSLSHLVVGTGVGILKTGSASRSDRTAKYNELLRLDEKLALPLARRF